MSPASDHGTRDEPLSTCWGIFNFSDTCSQDLAPPAANRPGPVRAHRRVQGVFHTPAAESPRHSAYPRVVVLSVQVQSPRASRLPQLGSQFLTSFRPHLLSNSPRKGILPSDSPCSFVGRPVRHSAPRLPKKF